MSNHPKVNKGVIVNTTYIGPREEFAGKSCLARESGNDNPVVEVQFSDAITGMSKGWHPMPRRDLGYWAATV